MRFYNGEELIRADKQWQAYVIPSRSKAENMYIDRIRGLSLSLLSGSSSKQPQRPPSARRPGGLPGVSRQLTP